ncbi:MAG TPA: hypothetical protein VMQ58_02350 [Candidatus Saccharimonadales bacterium]|jgi:hypothetical protein|nr:hypothetical protein [Candidatus Saccharimonadales bacterium]
MIAGFRNILIGVIVFVSVNTLLGSTIMTGTDVGTVLLKALLGLIVAFGVLVGAFTMFGKGK